MNRNRELREIDERFRENAWDNVEMSSESRKIAEEKIKRDEQNIKTEPPAMSYAPWNDFYQKHEMSFFKDRKWIKNEFPELQKENQRILEIGCGTGSSLASLISKNEVFGIDCAPTAIDIIKKREGFKESNFSVQEITQDGPLKYREIDSALLIFVLSATPPATHLQTLRKINECLNPQGLLFFRDYAHMDMAQLRFKPEQIVEKNLYRRGDGTLAYFFTEEVLRHLAQESGFELLKCEVDRRLLINRKKKLEMQRCWIQATLKKK